MLLYSIKTVVSHLSMYGVMPFLDAERVHLAKSIEREN